MSYRTVNHEASLSTSKVGHKILILAEDPMLAALLGALAELARFEAAFPRSGESADAALARVKPLVALLVEASNGDVQHDLFLARARKRGVRVLLFGSRAVVRARRAWADAHDVPAFELPDQVDELERALAGLGDNDRRPRMVNRRARTERDQDGTLIFHDGTGTRWSVYDRRTPGSERRRRDVDRQFVSESGEVRHCDVTEEEAASITVDALSQQLARATPLST